MSKPKEPASRAERHPKMDAVYDRYSYWHREFQTDVNYLRGKLLTLTDASFADAQQRKAFKDLINQALDEFFRERIRSLIICTFNDICYVLTGEKLFPDQGNGPTPFIQE